MITLNFLTFFQVPDLPTLHNEYPHADNSNELHLSQPIIDPVSSINKNYKLKNAPSSYNPDERCNIQNSSHQNKVPLVPLQNKSSPSYDIETFSVQHQNNIESSHSQMDSPDQFGNHKETSSFPMLSSINCNSAMNSIGSHLDFNLKKSITEPSEINDNFNSFESNHQVVSTENFKTPNTLASKYQECQSKTFTFPDINLSDEKTLFTKCASYSCEEPACVSDNPFQTILSDTIHEHSCQFINKSSNTFEKTVYLLDKNKEDPVQSISASQISSQELRRVQDHLLTNNPLVPQENEKLDKQKNNLSMFFETSSMNTRAHDLNFKDTSKSSTLKQYKGGSLLIEKSDTSCLNNMIHVHRSVENEDTIQDTSDLYEHIMSNQCTNTIYQSTSKTNVYSNEEHSRDGLANISIEHLNDNSLSNIEINEKLSEDLLNKETNLNLYTTNLTGFINGDNQFNEEPVANERAIMNTCDSLGGNQQNDMSNQFQIAAVFQENMMDKQVNNVNMSNRDEEVINKFDCNTSIVFEKKLHKVADVLGEKLPIESNCIAEIASVNFNENHVTSTDTAELDNTDLSHIILNNDIFTLADKNQSIQKIKETYNFGEESSVLMIENPVDNLAQHLFQVSSKQEVQDITKSNLHQPVEPTKEKMDLELIQSGSIKPTHSNEILTCGTNLEKWTVTQLDQDPQPLTKCRNEIHEDNENFDEVAEQFNTKQVEMDINDLYHDGPDFLHSISSRERLSNDTPYLSDVNTNSFENRKRDITVEESLNHINLLTELKSKQQNEEGKIVTQQRDVLHSKPKKIKRAVINSKSKIKTKACINKGSSIPPLTKDLRTNVEHPRSENAMDIINHAESDYSCNQNQLLEPNQITERLDSPMKLEPIARNTLAEIVKPLDTLDESTKRKRTDLSHECLVENPPAKRIKYEDKDIKTENVFTEKIPEASSVNDFTETPGKTVNSKSKKEQALNKLKLILITNKDVNLNNELININEEEVLQNSHVVNESNEKSMNIDDSSKSLIDNSKLMDEDNETIMGSQMLDNIEMFGNLSEYFNIDQNNELNQELNNEEDVQNTTLRHKESTEAEELSKMSTNIKGKLDQTSRTVEVKKKRKSSVKLKVIAIESNQKKSKIILDGEKTSDPEILKQPAKKKNTSKLLKNTLVDKPAENIDINKSNEKSVQKPKMIKQIFCKTSSNRSSNSDATQIADNINVKENSSKIKSTLEKSDGKLISGETFNKSFVDKTENFTKTDTGTKAIPETQINEVKETLKLVTSKRRSVNSRSRSNSTDSHNSDSKKKSNSKILADSSLELSKKSVEVVSQDQNTSYKKEDANQDNLKQEKVTFKPKPKKKPKPKTEPPTTLEVTTITNKPTKSKKTKTATCHLPIKEVKRQATDVPEASVESNRKYVDVKESLSDQIVHESSDNVEARTHKDIECQTDEQMENHQIIVLNDIPTSCNESTHSKYLYRTVTERFMLLNEPLHRIPFPETNLSFSTCKMLPNLSSEAHYNINELEDDSLKSSPSSLFSLKCVKRVEMGSADNKVVEEEQRHSSPHIALTKIFLRKEPDIRSGNIVKDGEQHFKNVEKSSEVKKHILTNQKISEKIIYSPDTIASISEKHVSGSTRRMKKEPKYIMMKLNGIDKVYKLIDKPLMKGILPPASLKTLEKKFPVTDSSLGSKNVNEQNIEHPTSPSHGLNVNSVEHSIGNYDEQFKNVPRVARAQNFTNKEIVTKSNSIRSGGQSGNALPSLDKTVNIAMTLTRGTTEFPKRVLEKNEVKCLVNKIRELNQRRESLIGSNVKAPQRTEEDHNQDVADKANTKTAHDTEDSEIISTIEIKKGVPIHLKQLPLTKHVNPPKEKRIIRMVPLYANKAKESKINFEERQRKLITNNNIIPLEEIKATKEDTRNITNYDSKSLHVPNNNDVKALLTNNRKNHEEPSQALLDPNKLILDFLHKNKIKTIIVGCKNKEIIRRDLSDDESSRIEYELRNANRNFLASNDNEKITEKIANINETKPNKFLCRTDFSKGYTSRLTKQNISKEFSEDVETVVTDMQVNGPKALPPEMDKEDENLEDQINTTNKNVEQHKSLELEKPEKTLDLIAPLTKKNLDKCHTNSGQTKDSKNGFTSRANNGKEKKVTELTKAIEDLGELCDIVQIYKCKLCTYTSNVKNRFVHHLKSSHDRVSIFFFFLSMKK